MITLIAWAVRLHLVLASAHAGLAWQDEGHLMVNRVTAEQVPDDMPAFFRAAADRLAYLGPEPDRWRRDSEFTLKASQEPDHFIKLEVIDGIELGSIRSRYEFYGVLYDRRAEPETRGGVHPDSLRPEHVGLLPFVAIEIYDRLKVAFREYRALRSSGGDSGLVEGNIVLYAGWLGHYVADAANPNHASMHYDGWREPNPLGYAGPGIHGRFEGEFIRGAGIQPGDFSDRVGPAERLEDPFIEFLDLVYESQELVEELYRLDREGGFDGSGSEEGLEFALDRLAAGSQMLLDLWYTAWLASRETR